MILNNYRIVSIAVGFSQRAGNGTTPRGTLVPDKPEETLILGLKPPLRTVLPSIRQLKQTAMDLPPMSFPYCGHRPFAGANPLRMTGASEPVTRNHEP